MKKIEKLKLGQLSKNSLDEKKMNRLVGGTYCYWGDVNQAANESEGKCSCPCYTFDYYAQLDRDASLFKDS